MVITPSNQAPERSGEISDLSDMQRLVTKADKVRREIDELVSLRDSAVAAARQEADDVRDEARREAQDVIAEADDTARATVEQAHAAAEGMIRAVRDELERIIETAGKRKSALDATLSALGGMSRVLPKAPEKSNPGPVPERVAHIWGDRGESAGSKHAPGGFPASGRAPTDTPS